MHQKQVQRRTRILMAALPPEMIDNLVDNEKFFEDYH